MTKNKNITLFQIPVIFVSIYILMQFTLRDENYWCDSSIYKLGLSPTLSKVLNKHKLVKKCM